MYEFDVFLNCYNRLELTINCVNALYKHTQDFLFRLTVLDDSNDPIDLTPEYFQRLSKEKDNIQYVHPPNRRFRDYDERYNWGLERTDCPYVIFLNNSCLVEPGWIAYPLSMMKENAQIGVVGIKSVKPNGLIENAGVILCDNEIRNIGWDEPGHRYSFIYQVDAVGSNACLFRREAIKEGFDFSYYLPWHGPSDIDYCLQLKQKGWGIYYCGYASVVHHMAATRSQDPLYLSNFNENMKRFRARWQYLLDREQAAIKLI